MIKLGDFVGQMHPDRTMVLKKGIVVESLNDSYVVQWLSFNKLFGWNLKAKCLQSLISAIY